MRHGLTCTMQHTATHCNTLLHTHTSQQDREGHVKRHQVALAATHCNILQQTTATHCSTLQHTATHCNTL